MACRVEMVILSRGKHHGDHLDSEVPRPGELLRQALPLAGCAPQAGHALMQVATEWLFSVPDHILHKHLASDPNTPVAEVASPEDHRVFTPRRVRLQVLSVACR